jgi:glyoxylase-like metal-dependent hydrolase (beta-lactamase superfamily II)
MVASLGRLASLPDALRVLPGHGRATTIARERALLELVTRDRRLPL